MEGDKGRRGSASGGSTFVAILRFCLMLFLVLASVPAPLRAAAPSPDQPAKISQLLELLADPQVQDWIKGQEASKTASSAEPKAAQVAVRSFVTGRLGVIRENMAALVAVIPKIPAEFARAGDTLARDLQGRSLIGTLVLLVAALPGLGFGAEWLFVRATGRWRSWIIDLPMTTVGQRLPAIKARWVYGTAEVIAFALGSVGVFLIFDWSPLLREILLLYLLAVLAVRLALAVSRLILAPGTVDIEDGDRLRILPMNRAAARFWHWRLSLLVGWFAFGYTTLHLVGELGFDPLAQHLVAYILGLGLLAGGIEMVWRHPASPSAEGAVMARRPARALLLSTYFVLLWALWVASAFPLMWLLVVLVVVPWVGSGGQRALVHILRPLGSPEGSAPATFLSVALQRAWRALLFIGSVLFLAHVWQIDLVALTSGDTVLKRLVRGALGSAVIVLLADFAWNISKTAVDLKLAEAPASGDQQSAAWRRQARLKTMLPIFRYIFLIVLVTMVVLMVLATLGIDIGPLIAAASVLGVAIGFGAQSLVRDIIAGMFYLLDDAFRVGEYIQSGTYKGTVESFSLRSVRLRHHRGPIYIVPFGALGAVQNMSRDWVIDKFMIGVTYDTDLGKAKKIINQIGKELQQDPELGPKIMETMKFQGLEQFGDFAIQIRMKMMTKPGEQFPIRRRAFAMIKQAFDANGIKFAFPTMDDRMKHVAGDEATSAAGASAALQAALKAESVKPSAAGA